MTKNDEEHDPVIAELSEDIDMEAAKTRAFEFAEAVKQFAIDLVAKAERYQEEIISGRRPDPRT